MPGEDRFFRGALLASLLAHVVVLGGIALTRRPARPIAPERLIRVDLALLPLAPSARRSVLGARRSARQNQAPSLSVPSAERRAPSAALPPLSRRSAGLVEPHRVTVARSVPVIASTTPPVPRPSSAAPIASRLSPRPHVVAHIPRPAQVAPSPASMAPRRLPPSPVVPRTPHDPVAARPRPAALPSPGRAPEAPAARPALPRRTLIASRPGDSGGRLALGGTSGAGTIDAGASGSTRAGSVANLTMGGSGSGAGEVPRGKGGAEPVPNPVKTADPGAQVAAPAHHEDPPPPARVKLRICARSGLLAGKYCDETTERSFLERDAPSGRCTRCQAPEVEHVNRVAAVSEPVLVKEVEPDYPEELREQGVQGTVTVRYTVDENGKVTDAGVARSSGSDVLDDAALRAIRRFRYRPAQQNGQPRPFQKTKQIVFRLSPYVPS